jgi:predicted acyltransferase
MSVAPTSPPDRLRSLDALRGFDMFWIIGGDALGRAFGKWFYGTPHNWIAEQLEHVEWEGFRFYDLIFPLFLFLVGAVTPFSLASLRRRGATDATIYFRICRRVLLLFALGLLCNGVMQMNWLIRTDDGGWTTDINGKLRITGVLQRIAICYGVAAVIALHTDWRGQLLAFAAILLGYWALMTWLPNPETGVAGDLTPQGNLSGYLDRHFLPGKIMKEYYEFGDNEGFLSTIPAVATALLGVLAGRWLRSPARPATKVAVLAAAGGLCLVLGRLWATRFPVIKILWTSSYVLVAGGWSLLLLALFYGVIDGLKWQAWAFPLVVIGMNAITIYVVPRFLDFAKIAAFFLGGVIRVVSQPEVTDHVGDLSTVIKWSGILLAEWLFLLWLYRQRLFLRV